MFVTTAHLPGYRLAFTRRSTRWGGGVADVVEEPRDEVWGAVWRIPLAERDALDRQEGLHRTPPHYRRVQVVVTAPRGETIACLAYQVATREAAHIAPAPAYLGTMLRGAADVGLPPAYVASMRRAAAGADALEQW